MQTVRNCVYGIYDRTADELVQSYKTYHGNRKPCLFVNELNAKKAMECLEYFNKDHCYTLCAIKEVCCFDEYGE